MSAKEIIRERLLKQTPRVSGEMNVTIRTGIRTDGKAYRFSSSYDWKSISLVTRFSAARSY